MIRVTTIRLLICLLLAPAVSPLLGEDTRPNIIIIMADDMGYSDIGCYGGEIETPSIDALADNGLRFTQFYNTARCCPTRAALLTGLHQHQTGIGQMTESPKAASLDSGSPYQGYLNRQCVTMAEVLKQAGYHTCMTGKWHLGYHGKEKWPRQRGFDRYYGIIAGASNYFKPASPRGLTLENENIPAPTDPNYYTTDAFTNYAIKFLEEQFDDRPFFLYLAYTAPHWPLQARKEDTQKYVGKYKDIGWDKLREHRLERQKALGIISSEMELPPRDEGVRAWSELNKKQRQELDYRMAVYAAMVDRMDQNVGKLTKYLRQQNQLENTLILFLSDNGGCAEPYKDLGGGNFKNINSDIAYGPISYGSGWAGASNTPFRKFKVFSHEGGTSTPLIAHWPNGLKAEPGSITDTPSQLIDIMPTILDVTGATYPQKFANNKIPPLEGVSLQPSLTGHQRTPAQWMFWEHAGHRAVRHGNYKALFPRKTRRWELYDLSNDRQELNNLVAMDRTDNEQEKEIMSLMASEWTKWANAKGVLPKPTAKSKNNRNNKKKKKIPVQKTTLLQSQ